MMKDRTRSAAELLVQLRRTTGRPMHSQLESELREAVRSGRLGPGTPLPSTRTLATELGVSRGVVVEAYEQLMAEGYLIGRARSATRVAPHGAEHGARAEPPSAPPRPTFDFRPGRPDVSQFPRAAWLRSVRRVLAEAPSELLSYQDGRGVPAAREALAAYLNRVRGAQADPDRVVISNGFTQGFSLVCSALRRRGTRRIAVEDPSHDMARRTIRAFGLDLIGIPTDDDGISVDALERAGAEAVLVTPAHQYPTGGVMTSVRRAALVAWARRTGGIVVEDDYDAEYRYDREPIGCIQGLAPDHVIYGGSASKTLAPGLRLGWLVVPATMVESMAAAKLGFDSGSPTLDQLAFADFLSRGEQDRHLRRMRPIYRERRDAVKAALARHLPQLRPCGSSAGLHLMTWLPPGWDEAEIVARAAARGVGIYGLHGYWQAPEEAPGGLIFGYAGASERDIDEGIRRLADAVQEAGGAG